MTPKMAGALESLRQLKSYAEDQSDKLTRRINDEVMPKLQKSFKDAHGTVDAVQSAVKDIDDFANALQGSNGGDPLDDSSSPSETSPPRSSEVASR